ncbi:MAG: type II toxin-antitoxin system VapB family antitoxin [Acidimicrobiales bacterium]
MARTMIDINEALLSAAAEELGTTTKRATVEAALRVVAGKAARRRLAELIAATGKTPKELDAERDEAWR